MYLYAYNVNFYNITLREKHFTQEEILFVLILYHTAE